jgi:hypothetical protein
MISMHELQLRDLGEAAALLFHNYELKDVQPSPRGNYKIFFFIVDDLEKAESVLSQYRQHSLTVDAYRFFMHTKELKTRLHAQ